MKTTCRLGTSGWSYNHWNGLFYPEEIPLNKRFTHYQTQFSTVEINATFYHLPPEKTFIKWQKETGKNFIFAIKSSRVITHFKKLKNIEKPLNLFLSRVRLLKKKLGVILYQLPPSYKRTANNLKKLEAFLELLPKNLRQVVEFRDDSWSTGETYKLLKKYRIAYCIISAPDLSCNLKATTNFVYIRLHGISNLYAYNYTENDLKWWTGEIKKFLKQKKDCYVYFNNDARAYAPFNALRLQELIEDIN